MLLLSAHIIQDLSGHPHSETQKPESMFPKLMNAVYHDT